MIVGRCSVHAKCMQKMGLFIMLRVVSSFWWVHVRFQSSRIDTELAIWYEVLRGLIMKICAIKLIIVKI